MKSWSFRSTVAAATAAAALVIFSAPGVAQSAGSSTPSFIPPGFPCVHANVTPLFTWGWFPLDGDAPRFAEGSEASGAGWLDMTAAPGGRTTYFHPGINTALRDLAASPESLSFRHQGRFTSFQLRLRGADRPGEPSGFTTLVWWPPANGNVGENGWATAALTEGQWWSTNPIGGLAGGQGATATLRQIADANPRAFVTEYGVLNDSGAGAADDITYGCARWDFEPMPSGS